MKKLYALAFALVVLVFFAAAYGLLMLNESQQKRNRPETVPRAATIQYLKGAEDSGGSCIIQLWGDRCNAEFFAVVPCEVIPQQLHASAKVPLAHLLKKY